MRGLTVLLSLLFSTVVSALPSTANAISEGEYQQLQYYARFAQASYCTDNDEPITNFTRPRLLRCPNDACGSLNGRIKIHYGLSNAPQSERATGFIGVDNNHRRIVVSFRGTSLWKDVKADFVTFARQTKLAYFPECPGGLLDSCKTSILVDTQWNPVREKVFRTINRLLKRQMYSGYEVVFVGHSLGGAVATLGVTDYRAHYPYSPKPKAYLYTYATPRIFNRAMANYAQGLSLDNFRVTHYLDLAVRVPGATVGYEHIGPEYHIEGESFAESGPLNITRYLAPSSNFLAPLENPLGAYRHGTAGLPGEPAWHANYFMTISAMQCVPSRAKQPIYADLPNGPMIEIAPAFRENEPGSNNGQGGNWDNQGQPYKGKPKKGKPRQGTPPQNPQQYNPQQPYPQQYNPQQNAPQQYLPQQNNPPQYPPQQNYPQQYTPQQSAPSQQNTPPQYPSQPGEPGLGNSQQQSSASQENHPPSVPQTSGPPPPDPPINGGKHRGPTQSNSPSTNPPQSGPPQNSSPASDPFYSSEANGPAYPDD